MKFRKSVGLLLLAWVLNVAADRAPTTHPTASPSEVVAMLIDHGFQALQAGEPAAAIEQLADARIFALKNQLGTTPAFRQIEYGLGVANMMLGRFDRTRGYFDRSNARPTERDQVYNLGAFDLRTRRDLARSLKFLSDYLTAHEDADEEMLAMFGSCLDKAVEDHLVVDQKRMADFTNLFLKHKKNVEGTQSDKILWGANWLTKEEYDRIQKLDKKAKWEISQREPLLESARTRYNQAVQRQRDDAIRTGGLVMGANNEVKWAQNEIDRIQKEINDFNATLHRPDFPKQMPAMVPKWKELPARLAGDIPVLEIAGVTSVDRSELKKSGTQDGQDTSSDKSTGSLADATDDQSKMPAGVSKPPVRPVTSRPPVASKDIDTTPPVIRAPKEAITIQRTAAAVPVGPDLLVTSISVTHGATRMVVDSDTVSREVTVLRSDQATGLSLLRVAGANYAYFNLASTFAGGPVQAVGYPTVSMFLPEPQTITGTGAAQGPGDWRVSLQMHPRLAGTPVMNANRELVGVVIATRDDDKSVLPTVPLKGMIQLLGADRPKTPSGNPQAAAVQQITADIKSGGE